MSTTPSTLDELLEHYQSIFEMVNEAFSERHYPGNTSLIDDFKSISDPTSADQFFEKYGVGNPTTFIHLPFERQMGYEILLTILKEADPAQYAKIHKGTPYYFIGWLCYQYFNIGKAIFYMDAAVSEDLKLPDVVPGATRPSLDFFLLQDNAGPTALPNHMKVRSVVEKTLQRYQVRGGNVIPLTDLRQKFLRDLLFGGSPKRSVLTTLFTFLLEFDEREKEIQLRSDVGGSTQPFLNHLFDGARLTESLLKLKGGGGLTLRNKIISTSALQVNPALLPYNKPLQDAKIEYLRYKAIPHPFQDCHFAATYIIRNTTGHSVDWPDQFATVQDYKLLYECVVDSILWTVEKLWL